MFFFFPPILSRQPSPPGCLMAAAQPLTLHVNGVAHQLQLDPGAPLLYVLRSDLGLKGPKYGCGSEQCGSCKILLDGVDVPSCQLPVSQAADREITTVEGLGRADAPNPLQAAFLAEQAAQCGFCSAGMIVAAQALLNRVPQPDDDDIRTALEGNLCRCGIYDRVRRAIKRCADHPEAHPICKVITASPLAPGSEPEPSASLARNPELDQWLRIDAGGISIFSGKIELGQGIATALKQIAADELDLNIERIRIHSPDTALSPDEGGTTGSRSLETSGLALRQAAAEARHHLLGLAFEHLHSQTPAADLQVLDGVVSDPRTGKQVSYWELMAGKRFGRRVTGLRPLKAPSMHQWVGRSQPRLDLPGKFSGAASYVQDMDLPGMLHARVVFPPNYHARLLNCDESALRARPGVVNILRDGSFLALAAEREEEAIQAAELARDIAEWEIKASLPPQDQLYADMLAQPAQSQAIVAGVAVADPMPDRPGHKSAGNALSATYRRPFQMHAALGPSAALALWEDASLTVWSHTQAPFALRDALAGALGMEAGRVRVIHKEGAGCYGHNGADDVALDAALVARSLPGRPIMLKWSREDEHAWEPYGSAMIIQLSADLSAQGRITSWTQDITSFAHSTRPAPVPGRSGLLAAWRLADPSRPPQPRPMSQRHSGAHRNADPIYDLPGKRIVRHALADSPLRVSALRSLGAYANIFAIESFMDELARAAKVDPLAFRLRWLRDERARAVLLAATERAGWQARQKAPGVGWGLALAQYKNLQCYAAIAVQLRVDPEGNVDFERVIIAAEAGQVVNPDGLSSQLEGGFTQAASWTLHEAVRYDASGISSLDWQGYPIMRFGQAPVIETIIINRPDQPFLGAGEAAQGPTPAAIANAIDDALGLRLRDIPFTPAIIRAALARV